MKQLVFLLFLFVTHATFSQSVTFTINTSANRKPISPYIYGINYTQDVPVKNAVENYTSLRLGGNRLTGYNWENNASNAGNDYIHNSDNFLCSTFNLTTTECNQTGGVLLKFHETANGRYALATLPTAGYVAADKNGPVSSAETAPSARWKEIKHVKGAAFTLTPSLTDAYVYSDEAVNFLVNRLGTAANGGIKGYCLDNEPALWPSTHPRIHPSQTGAAEVADKNIALAKAIKSVDPSAETFGGVFYGFSAYYNMQSATDWNSVKGSYNWYIDYYLDRLKAASAIEGKRLLDVLDIHWYPEAIGSTRIIENNATSQQDKTARMQAPRSLWDSSYHENSWIAQYFSSYLPLLPRVNASINQFYPGTKLSMSEYNYGGGNDISGGIAQADVLGIFGKLSVYSAQMWVLNSSNNYFQSAFRMFNNYNGNNRGFGNTSVAAATSDIANTSVYASVDGSSDSVVHIIAINKNSVAVNASFNLNSLYNTASVYRFDSTATPIIQLSDLAVNNTSFTYRLNPVSVNHFVLRKSTTLPLHLLSFDAVYNKPAVALSWKVEDELNTKGYQVQRSCNGTDFTTVGNLPALNGANKTYSFSDRNYSTCEKSTVFYRLQTDALDGNAMYSKTVAVKIVEVASAIIIYPNPTSEILNVGGLKPMNGTARISNTAGQVVMEFALKPETFSGSAFGELRGIDLKRLSKGTYHLSVTYSNGDTDSKRFVKN